MFIGLKKMGVDIDVMCSPNALYYRHLIDSGVPVYDFEARGRVDAAAVKAIRRRLKEKRYAILHGFNNKTISCAILAAAGIPVKIVAYRGIVGNVGFFNPGSWMTYLHPRVERVICVAEAVRQYFLNMRLAGLRLKSEKFVTIYKGHRLEWYQAQPADLSRFGIPADAFVVGCVANYRPRKGIHVLIDAARLLPERSPVHFLLVGDMKSERLKRQIRRSPLREAIHLTGYRPDAPALMAACDAYVLPALRREGLPKGVIEAMCYGVPPVVTDSGGSPELIEEGVSGMIVPSGSARAIAEAVQYLQEHPDIRRQMGASARFRIETRFRNSDTVAKTFRLYRELVNVPAGYSD
jgi:glycosyltransferase involved in cell wall biosynthesis